MAHGQGGAEIGFDRGPKLTCNHEAPIAAYALDVKRDLAPHGSVQVSQIASPLTATDYKDPQAVCITGHVTHTLKAEGFDASEDGTGRGQPIVVHGTQDPCVSSDTAFALGRCQPTTSMQVRRLMPEECEALQGFPRGYTRIPWRKNPASECPDGPRYKALGNSWAVPCVHWIGRRIEEAM